MSILKSFSKALWFTAIVYAGLLFFAVIGFPVFSDFLFSSVGVIITFSVVMLETVWLTYGFTGTL